MITAKPMRAILSGLLAGTVILSFACGRSGKDTSMSDSHADSENRTSAIEQTGNGSEAMTTAKSELGQITSETPVNKTTKTVKSNTSATTIASQPSAPEVLPSGSFQPKAMSGEMSEKLLYNPNRGFRLEMQMYIPATDGAKELDGLMQIYTVESPRIVQVYFYLTAYRSKDLDKAAFDAMQAFMDHCRIRKMQVLLRFAYVANEGNDANEQASTSQMLRHLEQLKPFLAKNRDVLFAMEAGMIAPWGEWSGGAKPERKPVLEGLLNCMPNDLFLLVRYVPIKNMLEANDSHRARVGYHDDYLVGTSHHWNSGNIEGTPTYEQMMKESENVLVQGEMPWGGQYNTPIIGLDMAQHLSRFHFTALSLFHHYRESGAPVYAMAQWQTQYISPKILDSKGLTYQAEWFKDKDGAAMERNVYEYIRDYLGYYIVAEKSDANIDGKYISATIRLKNYGFATPLTLNSCQIVIADAKGNIVSTAAGCDVTKLKRGQTVECKVKLTRPDVKNDYYIGVVIKNRASTPARLANDVPYKNGVNLIGRLT